MSVRFWRLGASSGLTVLVALSAGCGSDFSPQVHEVVIDATSYSPQTLEVSAGDSVVWTNRDMLVHTVTARDGAFDSKDIASGESWRYEVFTPGDLDYLCLYHPTMRGLLRAR